MIEDILAKLSSLPVFWIYISLFFFSFIENVFPPSPSDLVVVVGGSLVATGAIHFIPTLILTTLGSLLGFFALYYFGSQLDRKVIRAGKIKYISVDALDKAEKWFNKYGYFIILANRFMPGTRSVISFFAGLSELKLKRTLILAAISAFLWNSIILTLGYFFGDNIQTVDRYLSTYSNVVLIVTITAVVLFIIYLLIRKRKKNT